MKNKNKDYPKNGRVILHIDMNAFYCSVHCAVEPEKYKGKCMAVAGSVELRKGIIVTSSYEARKRGVRTGMQVGQALKICPGLIVIQPNFDLYRQFSKRFMRIVSDYSPLVEAMSIDECFVDITGSSQFGSPLYIAETMQNRIGHELQLPCSIGIAPNKLLAKMASDLKKPNGITVLRLRDVKRVLWPRPCSDLFGVGESTARKLSNLGIRTIGDLAQAGEHRLIEKFGVLGHSLKQAANGINHSPVDPRREKPKSVGHTTTLPRDYTEKEAVHRVFFNLADQVGRRLRRNNFLAKTIQISIRDPAMKTIQRSMTLYAPTESSQEFYRAACELFDQHWNLLKPVRLLGITLMQLVEKGDAFVQQDMFSFDQVEKSNKLIETMDLIRDKYGENALLNAGMLGDDPSSLLRNRKLRGTSLDKEHLYDWDNEDEPI